jgi:glucose/arabinose dehydrogenase/cytochrome c5
MKIRTSHVVSTLLLVVLITSAFVFNNKAVKQLPPADGYVVDTLAGNLIVPWQIAFLPDGSMLFTEREGRVRVYRNNKLSPKPIFTVADLTDEKKMGLLGLAVHPDFAKNKYIYLASNYTVNNFKRLKVIRYVFKQDSLVQPLTIIQNIPANQNHTGCRLVFGPGKKLFITAGDADQPALAQDLKAYNGKILRVNDDGSIPADNPFIKNDTAKKEIYTYGHRNPQGLAFQPGTGILFDTEHGPTGGDEINIIKKGQNYGWPVIHHQDTRAGMITPLLEYTPSIGPAEALFYTGKAFPQLKNNLLVACLRGQQILRVQLDGNKVIKQEVLFKNKFGRIRSLVTGPDGYIYFSTSMIDRPEGLGNPPYDMILRLRPAAGKLNLPAESIAGNVKTDVQKPSAAVLFNQLCAACHGDKLQGTEKTKSLLGANFAHGADKTSIVKNITNGITTKRMPAWGGAISKADIDKIADYILIATKK